MGFDRFYTCKIPNGYLFACKRDFTPISRLLKLVNLLAIALISKYRKFAKYLVLLFLVNYYVNKKYIVEERLIMLSNFGLQIETTSAGNSRTFRSIPISNVGHVLINEAFTMQEIIFYMLITLKDSRKIVLPFRNCKVRLENLKVMYNTFNSLFNHDPLKHPIEYVP